ncbi:rhodanese-like domain-containing protein [Pontibacter sp. 13R65]|uniref:rhodanese-like domain-containing protein n=1 Tax=Pontibacter sp. 13R65 TaxID=3127458 RepID=UPI00301E28BF
MEKTLKEMVAEANQQIKTYEVTDAMALLNHKNVRFIDVRDEPELVREGKVPGATHASRGMLEFYIDPHSPYHKDIFASDAELVFYCKSGGRSALAAQKAQEMGVKHVAHIAGGFNAWKEQGGAVAKV